MVVARCLISAGDLDVPLTMTGSHTLGSNIPIMSIVGVLTTFHSNVIILLNIQSLTNEDKTTKED